MPPDRSYALTLSVVEVTPATRWTFVEIETVAGLRGVGEATLAGEESAVCAALAQIAPSVLQSAELRPVGLGDRRSAALPMAAILSALDQAQWDLQGQAQQRRVADLLGSSARTAIPVYANINRRTHNRSPAGFIASACAATAAGHNAIKLAPFDEADPSVGSDDAAGVAPGLARVAAVRAAVGPGIKILIDCHWRLNPLSADRVVAALAELDIAWLECPLPETREHMAAIVQVRRSANARGILLAGLETAVGIEGFQPFLAAGAYDVVMPDVKYVGGLTELLALSPVLARAGVAMSPHNPSGPVSHAASLQACAVVPDLHSLEVQFDETSLFADLVTADLRAAADGTMRPPGGPGLGLALRADALANFSVRHWRMTADQVVGRAGETYAGV